jgi:replicative DNA helicase
MTSIATVVDKAVEQIEKWRLNEGTLTGVPSGFPELDRATRGWQPGDLIILGARPSVGKTAFALNLVRHAALNKEKPVTVAVWSLEMKSVYLALRMLAAESEMYLHRLQTGRMDDDQMFNLKRKGAEVLRRAPIFFDDSSKVSLKVIRSKARKLKKKSNLGLIVIDYLQLMSGDEDTKGNREQEIARISRGLKNLAQELDVPIIALSQLTRDAATNISWEQSPGISSLRESGSIEQDADLIMMLWGPTENEEKNDGDLIGKRKIKIGKQRNGMLITEVLNFKNEIQLFSAIDQQVGGNFTRIPNDYTQPKNNIEEDSPF